MLNAGVAEVRSAALSQGNGLNQLLANEATLPRA